MDVVHVYMWCLLQHSLCLQVNLNHDLYLLSLLPRWYEKYVTSRIKRLITLYASKCLKCLTSPENVRWTLVTGPCIGPTKCPTLQGVPVAGVTFKFDRKGQLKYFPVTKVSSREIGVWLLLWGVFENSLTRNPPPFGLTWECSAQDRNN